LQRQGIPLAVIEQAMLMGACRKYGSWFEGNALEPIRSLTCFSPLIAEVQEKHTILGSEVFDDFLLSMIDPAGEDQNKQLPRHLRLQDEFHMTPDGV
jgi:hypothetical protein